MMPPRYQDKRKVEKLNQREFVVKQIKPRKKELLIPIQVSPTTIYWVRQSKITKPKWLKYFDSIEQLTKYIQDVRA